MSTPIMSTVSVEKASELLVECIKLDEPLMLHGDPGVGKTSIVRQGAERLGIGIKVFIPSHHQPTDLTGLPVPDLQAGVARWLKAEDLPDVERDGEEGIAFLDEINTAPQLMQASLYQWIHENRVGVHELPKGWRRVAAGNLLANRAAAQRMSTALDNRMTHLHVVPTLDGWVKWANLAHIHPYMIAYQQFRGGKRLHIMPESPEQHAWPSPRSNAEAGKFLDLESDKRVPLIAGKVGEAQAQDIETFLQFWQEIPSFDEIVADPENAHVPVEPGHKWAATGLIARSCDRGSFDKAITYAKRLGRDFEVLAVTMAVGEDESLKKTKTYVDWSVENQHIAIS